jgi:hypothetical protein
VFHRVTKVLSLVLINSNLETEKVKKNFIGDPGTAI